MRSKRWTLIYWLNVQGPLLPFAKILDWQGFVVSLHGSEKPNELAFDRTRATTQNRPIVSTDAERNSQIHCIPQCTHAIHSTRAKNLSTDTTLDAKRNSGVRRQFAVFEVTAFPKATTLKTSTAANQGKKLSSAAGV